MEQRFEIKITKDADRQDIDINAMSLKAAQSFRTLFDSLTKIIGLTPGGEEIKIQIKSGSAIMAAEGRAISDAKKEFDSILENQSENKELIEHWRNIQSVFMANGLSYEASFHDGSKIIQIYETLRSHAKLRVKPVTEANPKTELEFIVGKLIEVGGKTPNIHVEVGGKALPPISCTEISAKKANAYLYQTIRFSAWSKEMGGIKRYTFCDSYANEDIYLEYKSMIKALFEKEQIEVLKRVHYICRGYLDAGQYRELRRFIRLFLHESTDINILKMILIVTQSVRQHDDIRGQLDNLNLLFEQKFRKHQKNNSK